MAVYHNVRGTVTYTIVGSPTIVDGVASGFSDSDYLSIGSFTPTTPWEAIFRVKTPSTAGSRYFLGSLGYGLVVGSSASSNKVVMKLFCSSNGSSWDLANIAAVGQLELDTLYYIRFGFSGTEYYIDYSSDGIEYTGRNTSNSTTNIISSNLLIGTGYGTGYYWPNEIDLNSTYITVNGQPWFGVCPIEVKKHQVKGPVGYTVVGSPTITDGVASGFSASNCLAISQQLDTSKPFEITIPFRLSATGTTEGIIGVPTTGLFMLWILSNKKLKLSLSQNTTAWSIGEVTGSTVLDVDTDYIVKILFTGTKYSFSLSADDGETWTNQGEISSTSLVNDGSPISLQLGRMHSNNYYLRGSINLNYATIKVNDKLWFWQPQETKKIIVNGVEVYSKP